MKTAALRVASAELRPKLCLAVAEEHPRQFAGVPVRMSGLPQVRGRFPNPPRHWHPISVQQPAFHAPVGQGTSTEKNPHSLPLTYQAKTAGMSVPGRDHQPQATTQRPHRSGLRRRPAGRYFPNRTGCDPSVPSRHFTNGNWKYPQPTPTRHVPQVAANEFPMAAARCLVSMANCTTMAVGWHLAKVSSSSSHRQRRSSRTTRAAFFALSPLVVGIVTNFRHKANLTSARRTPKDSPETGSFWKCRSRPAGGPGVGGFVGGR